MCLAQFIAHGTHRSCTNDENLLLQRPTPTRFLLIGECFQLQELIGELILLKSPDNNTTTTTTTTTTTATATAINNISHNHNNNKFQDVKFYYLTCHVLLNSPTATIYLLLKTIFLHFKK